MKPNRFPKITDANRVGSRELVSFRGLGLLNDRQLLTAAGLWLLPTRRKQGDGRYVNFLGYASELRRRKLTWAQARSECARFLKRNPDYHRGSRWEKRETRFEANGKGEPRRSPVAPLPDRRA